MANETYTGFQRKPGDLLTAEHWNKTFEELLQNTTTQIETAIGNVNNVDNAKDAETLGGKTPAELSDAILERVAQEIPKRTGYRKLIKQLRTGEEAQIKHDLKACPLVDVYELYYFPAVCAENDAKRVALVNFYLYHSTEKRLRVNGTTVDIESGGQQPYKIEFEKMLEMYGVKYTPNSSLGDLVNEFWKAFFSDPNDRFDPDQYCNSPWFVRCCGEDRSVESLKRKGDWDDLWFKMMPRKTINYTPDPPDPSGGPRTLSPVHVRVVHFDFDTIGVTSLLDLKSAAVDVGGKENDDPWKTLIRKIPTDHAKLMLLLKV